MDPKNQPNAGIQPPEIDGDDRVNPVTGETPTLAELRQSVGEITRILHVRRWLFFVPICVVMSGAFIVSLRVPRQYQAKTTFERRDDPVLVNLPRTEGSGAFITFRKTLDQDVTNIDKLVDVARKLKAGQATDTDESDRGGETELEMVDLRRDARRIASGLQVRVLQESEHLDVIQIQYTSQDPNELAATLDLVRDNYIKRIQIRITKLLQRTKEWFEAERQKRAVIVESLEDDLIEYRTEHQGLDPLDPGSSMVKLRQLRADLIDAEQKGVELQTQIDGRKNFIQGGAQVVSDGFPSNVVADPGIAVAAPSPAVQRRASELRAISRQITDLKTVRGMTDRHPEVVALLRKRENLAAELDEQIALEKEGVSLNGSYAATDLVDPLEANDDPLLADRARAEMEVEIYENLLAQNERAVVELRNRVAEFEILRRDALIHRKEFAGRVADVERARRELILYQEYADQVGRVLAAENSQRGILFERIIPARGSSRPISPRISTILVLALTIGLTTGVVLVLVSEIFDRTVRTRRQVTSGLGLTVLESIGEIVSSAERRKRLFARVCLAPAAVVLLVTMVGVSGTMAYLSLTNRDLYERAISIPKAALERMAEGATPLRFGGTELAQNTEHEH